MQHRLAALPLVLVPLTLALAACGSKTPSAPDAAAPVTAAPTTSAAAPDAAARPPAADVAAPGPADGAATPTPDAAGAASVAPAADDASGASVAAADAAVAADAAAPLPADLPTVPGLAPEVVARALAGAPGCVGIAKSGRAVLSIIEAEVDGQKARELRYTDSATPDRQYKDQGMWAFPACEGDACAAKMRELLAAPALTDLTKNHRFVACHDSLAAGNANVIAKPVPIAVTSSDDAITVAIDGNAPLTFDKAGELADVVFQTAYWADDVGAVFLRVAPESGGLEASRLIAIGAADLGDSLCVPRPTGPKPAVVDPPPAFDPNPASPSCVAMTPDGKMAAFKIFRTGENAAPNTADWFGVGTAPDIDLGCLVRSCKKPEHDAAVAAATKAGLIGCREARGTINIDGWATPWMYKGNEVKLKTGNDWRVIHRLAMSAHDGGDHEQLWKVFQFAAGGPVFLYVGNADTGLSESRVKVLGAAEMNLCAVPAEVLRVAEVHASSASKDVGGYHFDAGEASDGDVTTSWQPVTGKPEDPSPWIELTLADEQTVAAVEIANGFQRKDGNGDLFPMNARAAELTLTFADGSVEKATFGPDERGLKRIDFAPRKTKSVKVTIAKLHPGSKWAGDLAISEVRLLSAPRQ